MCQERVNEREEMVEKQIKRRGIEDPDVLNAMRQVPRHYFVSEENSPKAYADHPIPIGHGQTISQPYIVAYMTEKLNLGPDDKVLEIGTGSGYQAAVLSEITSHVYSVEIIKELAVEARTRLQRLGYDAVKVKHIDPESCGWKEHAPYNAILVTCAANDTPSPLKEQLKPGGQMIIPVGGSVLGQKLILVEKDEDGEIHSSKLMSVRFVPMQGRQ